MTFLAAQRHCWKLALVVCLIVGPLLPIQASAIEKPVVKPAAKQTKAAPSKKQATPSRKKTTVAKKKTPAAVPPPVVIDEAAVQSSFETFTQEWMAKLSRAEEYHRAQQIKVTEDTDGFAAEYIGYLPQRYIKVKKTTSQETPFVGTLTYYERTLRCRGKTKEDALKGPFEQGELVPVREIFRFTRGEWVY